MPFRLQRPQGEGLWLLMPGQDWREGVGARIWGAFQHLLGINSVSTLAYKAEGRLIFEIKRPSWVGMTGFV